MIATFTTLAGEAAIDPVAAAAMAIAATARTAPAFHLPRLSLLIWSFPSSLL
jgi:hypothetical protein